MGSSLEDMDSACADAIGASNAANSKGGSKQEKRGIRDM